MTLNGKSTSVVAWVLRVALIIALPVITLGMGCNVELVPEPEPPDGPPPLSEQPQRSLPAVARAGDDLEITVTFVSPDDGFHAVGLTELAPADWSVTVDLTWTDPPATLAHTPGPQTTTYIWEGPYAAGQQFTAVYRVKVPANAQPGTYNFDGSLRYYIEPHPAPPYEKETSGNTTVTVSS
jgi:hypothetical protein